jgi:hypothetical protein
VIKGEIKVNYIFHFITKGMHNTNRVEEDVKKKVPKRSKAKTQAHATEGGMNTKGITEELEALHVAKT